MFKEIFVDESGLTTIEFLLLGLVGGLIAIISFAALKTGIYDASVGLGNKIKDSVSNNGASW